MSSRGRVARNICIGLAALIVLLAGITLIVVNTNWFRDYVRGKIISSTEDAVGGRVELGAFEFQVSNLHASVANFVIHGREPSNAAPFVRIAKLDISLRLFTSFHRLVDISDLRVQRPEANVYILDDNRTNIPEPKQKSASNDPPLATVVDLAIGHFELSDGLFNIESRKQPFDLRGNNLKAIFGYNFLASTYQGTVALDPLYYVAGKNTPVRFTVSLPVTIARDRIELKDGSVITPLSRIALNGSIENLRNPKIDAHVNGTIATGDLQKAANYPLLLDPKKAPTELRLDLNAVASNDVIQVKGLQAGIGSSNIEASGTLKNGKSPGTLAFKTTLALGELTRLLKVSVAADGTLTLNGNASLDAQNNYDVNGNVDGRNVSVRSGTTRFNNVGLLAAFHADPQNIELKGARLSALGGEFAGNLAVRDFAGDKGRYELDGKLAHLDLQTVLRAAGQTAPYDGLVSGPVKASGNLSGPLDRSITADAQLAVSPAGKGVPVSGRINLHYDGRTDNIALANSYIALPHSRLALNGSVGKKLTFDLTSRDLNDLLAALPAGSRPSISVAPPGLQLTGAVDGTIGSPKINGHLSAGRFTVEGRQFDSLSADINASGSGAQVANGLVKRAAMQTTFTAAVGLKNWKPLPREGLAADVAIQNGDLADVMALAGQPVQGYSGSLAATAHIGGTIGNPQGGVHLQAANGTIDAQAFDRIDAQVNLSDELVTIPAALLESPAGRVNLTGDYRHSRDSLMTGRLNAHVQSTPVDLSKVNALDKAAGTLQLSGDVSAESRPDEFTLTAVNANVSARAIQFQGTNYGDLTAAARTSGQTVSYNLSSNFAGSSISASGNTRLIKDYPTTADANISNLPVERMLVLAKRTDIPARGLLAGSAHFAGTVSKPEGSADLTLAKGVVYDEPVDSARAKIALQERSIDLTQFEVVSGPSRVELTGRYDHPPDNFLQGTANFQIGNSHVDLARVHNIQSLRPGLSGLVNLTGSGSAEIREQGPRVLLTDVNTDLSATNLKADGKNFGNLTLKANTEKNTVHFALDSNLADASIEGRGTAELGGDYPVDAHVSFKNVLYTRIQSLLGPQAQQPMFEGVADGQVSVKGPVLKTDELTGSLQVTRLSLNTLPRSGAGKPITLSNEGPIAARLDHGSVRIQSARIVGHDTTLEATGSLSLTQRTLNLSLKANADLGLLPNFDRDIYSSGKIVAATTVNGTFSQPSLNGQMTLQNASFNYTGIQNGISNANGVIVFSGTNATIRNLTAESGGGTLSASGFVGFANGIRFGLGAHAGSVRVRIEEGVSVIAGGDLRLSGTLDNSSLSGTLLIDQVNWNPQSDIGSVLSRAAPPVQSASAPSPLLDNMRLDVRVRSAAGLGVQASLAQNLQADADLRVRGTAAEPGVTGRITVNEGQLVFFGSTYTVNNGTIAFYDPLRITPILDLSLETQAQGVDVVLRVTGPVDNMKLTYTSNPPLQFNEIVSLLASGKVPTSDPTLLANQPQVPAQSFQQMGESAIVGKALADPVSGRLQRVFGVSQLKIDPAFQTGSSLPTARLTLQQRINDNVTFTYTSALDDPNGQIIKVEWAFNPKWSAVATRDQNGIFSLNFFYKRQFR